MVEDVEGGIIIDLEIDGQEDGSSKQTVMTLYRVVQEELTNIQKHARRTRARVELVFGAQEAWLNVRDNGRGFAPMVPRQPGQAGGNGLQGLLSSILPC
jgi:signal transduction histidine kinase